MNVSRSFPSKYISACCCSGFSENGVLFLSIVFYLISFEGSAGFCELGFILARRI